MVETSFTKKSKEMSLQKKCGSKCPFKKNRWRMSLQRFCLVDFFCGIFWQIFFFKHSLVGMSLRRFLGKDFRFKDCLVRIFLDEFTVFCDVASLCCFLDIFP